MQPDATGAAGRIYRLAVENGLVWRSWDGEIVVLNEASGDTHRLDLFASAAFEILVETPADAPTLTRRLAEELGMPIDVRLETALNGALSKFADLNLLG
jgi:PqqD family protein of HPr-rel-A system